MALESNYNQRNPVPTGSHRVPNIFLKKKLAIAAYVKLWLCQNKADC